MASGGPEGAVRAAAATLKKTIALQQQALVPLLALQQNKYEDAPNVIQRMAVVSNASAAAADELCDSVDRDKLFALADATMNSDQAMRRSLTEVQKVLSAHHGGPIPRAAPAREMELARQVSKLHDALLEAKAVSGDQLTVREEVLRQAQDAAQRQRCELEDEAVRMRAAQVMASFLSLASAVLCL